MPLFFSEMKAAFCNCASARIEEIRNKRIGLILATKNCSNAGKALHLNKVTVTIIYDDRHNDMQQECHGIDISSVI